MSALLDDLAAALAGGGVRIVDLSQTLSPRFPQIVLPPENTPFSNAIVFGVVILVLLFRPQGILASRGVRVERV